MFIVTDSQLAALAKVAITNALPDIRAYLEDLLKKNIIEYNDVNCLFSDFIKNKANEGVDLNILTKQGIAKYIYIHVIYDKLHCKQEWIEEMKLLIHKSELQNEKIEIMDKLVFVLSDFENFWKN